MGAKTPHSAEPPVKTVAEAAAYVRRSPNALRILRHRRRGPRSFIRDGRVLYYTADLKAWLEEAANADSRFNSALDPTRVPPQARGRRVA
jgi:hypothetical protein